MIILRIPELEDLEKAESKEDLQRLLFDIERVQDKMNPVLNDLSYLSDKILLKLQYVK